MGGPWPVFQMTRSVCPSGRATCAACIFLLARYTPKVMRPRLLCLLALTLSTLAGANSLPIKTLLTNRQRGHNGPVPDLDIFAFREYFSPPSAAWPCR